MKFVKKVFISLSVIVLLFCSIFLSPKSDDYFKDTEVHAEVLSTAAIPFFALNPELIPVFLLGVFILTVCGIAINNVDKIVAAGTQLKNTIEEAGESVSTYVTNAKRIIVNEAFKTHVKNTIERMSSTRYSSGNYKFDTIVSGGVGGDLGDFAINLDEMHWHERNEFVDILFTHYAHMPLLPLRYPTYDKKGDKTVGYHEYVLALSDSPGSPYISSAISRYNKYKDLDYPYYVNVKPVTSISTSFHYPIKKYETEGYVTLKIIYYRSFEFNNDNVDSFEFNLFNYSNFDLQWLASKGILYEPVVASNGDITSFKISVLNSFVNVNPRYKYVHGIEINTHSNTDTSHPHLNPLNVSGPVTLNEFSGSTVKERAISYPNVKLLEKAYDKATIEKALDIAFPNELDNLVPLDNVLTNKREFANLKELDNVLDASARFLDNARTRGLDNVLTHADTMDLSGIDEAVNDKALDDTFNVRDYALDRTRVATAGIGAIPTVNDDTANSGAIPKEKEEAGWLSKVPFLGKLWDFLKEIIRLLNAILKAILEAIIAAMKATIAPVLEFLKAIVHTLQEIAKGRSLSDVLVNDVVVGDTSVLNDKFSHLQDVLKNKFPNMTPLNLSFTDKPAFDDFTANIPHVGTVTIISADMMNRFAPVAKAFFSGFFYFLTGLFFFRKFHKVSED